MATSSPAIPLSGERSTLADLLTGETRHRRRRRIAWSGGIALAVVLLVALAWSALRTPPVPFEERFRTAPAAVRDVVREVRATGHLEAQSTVEVGAEVSGRIVEVAANFNDTVRRGDVLARFDRTALEAQLAQAEAAVLAAQAAVEQAGVDAAQAERRRVRSDELFAQAYESAETHETAVAASEIALARRDAAVSELALRRAAAALARTNLGYTIVRSPIDGVVIQRSVEPGQTVAAAFQTPILFTVAADLRRMKVMAAIDEADVGEVVAGQPVTFTVNAWPDRVFTGSVVSVHNSPEVVQDVVTYEAEIVVQNDDLALKPGMTASIRVRTADAAGVLSVPAAALRFQPPGEREHDESGVWVLRSGALDRVAVRPGVSDGEVTAIESEALRPGDTVAVALTPAGKVAYGAASN